MNTGDNEPDASSGKIGVKLSVGGCKAVFFVGQVVNRGRPYKAVAHLYAGEFVWIKKNAQITPIF
jgi:hypothetical protein